MSTYEDWVANGGGPTDLSDWAKAKTASAFEQHSVKNYLELRREAGIGSSNRVAMLFNFGDGHINSVADLSCDKCGTYTPEGLTLWPIPFFATPEDATASEGADMMQLIDKAVLVITLGLCDICALEEIPDFAASMTQEER